MTRPLALAKLPAALRTKSEKVTDPGIANYLAQAATAIEKQNKKIQYLHNANSVQKRLIEELETATPKPTKKPELDWSDIDTSDNDWWDTEPDIDTLNQGW